MAHITKEELTGATGWVAWETVGAVGTDWDSFCIARVIQCCWMVQHRYITFTFSGASADLPAGWGWLEELSVEGLALCSCCPACAEWSGMLLQASYVDGR